MSLRDAVKVLAFRHQLSNLSRALELVGYGLAPPPQPENQTYDEQLELMSMREMLQRARWRRLSMNQSQREFDGSPDPQHGRDPLDDHQGWRWGSGLMRLGGIDVRHAAISEKGSGMVAGVLAPESAKPPAAGPPPLDLPVEPPPSGNTSESDVRLSAAVLSDMVRLKLPGPRLDVVKAVELLARMSPIVRLPKLARQRAARRVDVYYDIGLMVGPFGADLYALVRQIDAELRDSEISHIAFRSLLSFGCGEGPVWTWTNYRYPSVATASIFITGDFGGYPSVRKRELDMVMSTLERRADQAAHGVWIGALPPADGGSSLRWTQLN